MKLMLRSVGFEVTESDGDGVCTVKSWSAEEDALVCREYWPHWFGVGGDRDGFYIAGSCPAVRGTIPVSTASGWTLQMFKPRGFIILAYTNNGFSVDKKNQLDVTFCILYFSSYSSSTCFGQPCAHYQDLTTA